MADAITGNTELLPTKADIIASLVLKELNFKSIMKPLVSDYSFLAVKGAKTVAIPSFPSFTVANRTTATQGDASVLQSATDSIALSLTPYGAWIIDSADEIQSSVQVQAVYAERAGAALARDVDTKILAVLESDAGYNQGALTTITRDVILDMREYLLSKFADMSNVSLVVGTDQEKAMLKIAEFTNQYQFGAPNAPLMTGVIGKVFGVPVYVHPGLASGKAYMFDKAGVAIAIQQQVAYSEQPANQYGTGAKRAAIDMVWGTDSLYRGQLSASAGLSPLIAKM